MMNKKTTKQTKNIRSPVSSSTYASAPTISTLTSANSPTDIFYSQEDTRSTNVTSDSKSSPSSRTRERKKRIKGAQQKPTGTKVDGRGTRQSKPKATLGEALTAAHDTVSSLSQSATFPSFRKHVFGSSSSEKTDSTGTGGDKKIIIFDVVIHPVNYRRYTLLPLPFLISGAILVTSSLFSSPWLEYTKLQGGQSDSRIFREHVRVDLFEECRTDNYHGAWQCDSHIYQLNYVTFIQVLLFLNALMLWAAVTFAVLESGNTWLNETSDEVYQNVPGMMLLELGAAVTSLVSVLLIVIILIIFKGVNGGSAGLGFFTCVLGIVIMFVGALRAYSVSMEPVRRPAPWHVREVWSTEDDETVVSGQQGEDTEAVVPDW